jgi:O-antigen/teichoic acid export membrane protein
MFNFDNIISKYSKKFGLDLDYFLKNGFWTTSFQIISISISFILSIIFANYFSPEFYGKYNLITSILSLIIIFSIQEIGSTIIRSVSKEYEGTYFYSLKLILKYSSIGTTLLLIVSSYFYIIQKNDISFGLLLLAIIFPLYSISPYFQNYYIGKQKYKTFAKLNSISYILQFIILIFVLFTTKNVVLAILIPIITKLCYDLYITLIVVKKEIKNNRVDYKGIENSKKIYFSHILYVGSTRLEPILIGIFLGIKELAIYVITTLIPNQGKTLFNFISPTFLPKLTKNITKITKYDIFKHLIKLELIFTLMFLSYILLANTIFSNLYIFYIDYVILSMIFSITLLTIPQVLIIIYFKVKLNTKFIKYSNIFTIIASIVIVFPAIIFLGIKEIIYFKVLHSIITYSFSLYLLYIYE